MFYKSSTMVNFQESMEQKFHRNNLQTQFGVVHTPKDNQMRKIIGAIPLRQHHQGGQSEVEGGRWKMNVLIH